MATRGRPTRYCKAIVEQARKLCALGATDEDLADFFGVNESTINRWKKKYPEFLDALSEGKGDADTQVEQSLFSRAMGYSHPEVKLFLHEGKVIEHIVEKHYPPDTTACIFWLKNRQPQKWRDRKEVTGEGGGPIEMLTAEIPAEEATRRYQDLMG